MKLLFNNGNQHVSRDGAPDLRLYCVLAVADETLDAQMLLDSFEEQLDLPAALYSAAIVNAGKAVLLVRNTKVLPVSGSLKRMRRSIPG